MTALNISGVAVVDDDAGDAGPLINTISKNGIFAQYYDGRPEGMPLNPTGGIRLLFLDLWLGPGSDSPKNRKSKWIAILKRLIGQKNGPYLMIAWTGHPEDMKVLKEVLDDRNLDFTKPVACVSIDKMDVKTNGSYDFDKIQSEVSGAIASHVALEFLMKWEALSLDGIRRTTTFMTSELVKDEDSLKCLIKLLAESVIGDSIKDENLALKNSILELNKLLLDELDKNVSSQTFQMASLITSCKDTNNVGVKILQILNRKLNIRTQQSGNVPGAVYKIEKDTFLLAKDDIPDIHIENNFLTTDLMFEKVLVDVSPWCDYAQNKLKLRRFLPGYLCLSDSQNKPRFRNDGKTDYIYLSPVFDFCSKSAWLSLNIRFMITLENDAPSKLSQPLFTVRETMLSEIQQKIAHHLERIAVSSFK